MQILKAGGLCSKHCMQRRYLTLNRDRTVKIQFAFEIATGHDETEFPLKRKCCGITQQYDGAFIREQILLICYFHRNGSVLLF